jgi:hypothetical protein
VAVHGKKIPCHKSLYCCGNLNAFTRFVKLCAGRTGKIVAFDFGGELHHLFCSALLRQHQPKADKNAEAVFLRYRLGLLALNIEKEVQLENFYMRGNLFENLLLAEMLKMRYNRSLPAALYYLRDAKGNEVDCVVERGGQPDFVIYAGKEADYGHVHFCHWQDMSALS